MSKVIIYGDISPNVIDGSSIWLIAITENLAAIFDEVHLLLKMPAQNRRLLGQLSGLENVIIHIPRLNVGEVNLSTTRAAKEVSRLVEEIDPDVVLARGLITCHSLSRVELVSRRLWSYITDLPFPQDRLSEEKRHILRETVVNSQRLFAQTESARSYLENIVPEAAGRTLIMNPMIPDEAFGDLEDKRLWAADQPLTLIYSGKLAEDWKTLEMLGLPRALRARGIAAELIVVGDKYNRSRNDRFWASRMQSALRQADRDPESGVTWLGGLSRSESLEKIAASDIGISWRTPELDSNLEISTKTLEYLAAGTVAIVNRSSDNVELLGQDYPFYVDSTADVETAAKVICEGLSKLPECRVRLQSAAQTYSFRATQKRLRAYFQRAGILRKPIVSSSPVLKPRKVVIAAHDFKFLGELIDQLGRDPAYDLQLDKWSTLHSHDETRSRLLAEWADIVFCEWAGPNLRWYSHNIPSDTKLVSRLHGFELRGPWMREVNFETVDSVVFVSDFYRHHAAKKIDFKTAHTCTIPNMVDQLDFDRPKLPNAQFNLGMLGIVPFLKRPDRSLNLLEKLLEKDPRYTLFVKSRMPWEYPYEWQKPLQKQAYLEFFSKLSRNRHLAHRVVFEPFSPAVASWFRNIGIILSPSDQESFHLAVAEGMAAGTVPVVWERKGAREVFGNENVFSELNDVRDYILSLSDSRTFDKATANSKNGASRFDMDSVMNQWRQILA